MDVQTILIFCAVFAAGTLFAGALFAINYMASRKAHEDVLDERGFTGKKR